MTIKLEYSQSKSEAAQKMRAKLEKAIADGQASAAATIERVQNEVPEDLIVNTGRIHFEPEAGEGNVGRIVMQATTRGGGIARPMHPHALGQVASRFSMPMGYVNDLMARGAWGRQLVSDNLTRLVENGEHQNQLVRSVNGEMRGFLSDKFRRIDDRPLVDAFAQGCQAIGAVPVEGVAGDTRFAIKALLPYVFEPFKDEVIAIGLQLSNSNFGRGAASLRAFVLRLWCLNGCTMEEVLREIHLGRRLAENIEYSARTLTLDTQATTSALRDTMRNVLGPARINSVVETIQKANENKIGDIKQTVASLQKKLGLLKSEADAVRETFNNGGIEQLPPGQTMYRMSNALSWVAKSAQTPERRLELEQAAGTLLAA